MNLSETLQLVAMQLQLDPEDLSRFAREDTVGGYSANAADRRWMVGSLYEVEGKVLYALIRALKPQHAVEIGSLRGCSTTHIATALAINESGRLTAIDVQEGARDQFPKSLDQVVTGVIGDGLKWLMEQPDASIDFIFEDSSHGEDMCAAVGKLATRKLTPGGILVVHDAAHDFAILEDGRRITSDVGATVRRGLDRALGEAKYRVYRTEPSDCGFALWKRLGVAPTILDDGYSYQDLKEVDPQEYERPIEKLDLTLPGYHRIGQGEKIENIRIVDPYAVVEELPEGYHYVENAKPRPGDPERYITNDQPMQEIKEVKAPPKKKPGRKPKAKQ